MTNGFATQESTSERKRQFETSARDDKGAATGHFREAEGVWLSSIGIGTYLGAWDENADRSYVEAVKKYVASGGNVIDTAANYRFQRSEKCIGKALQEVGKDCRRSELFLCSKGGYLPFENEPVSDVRAYFEMTFVEPGIAKFDDLVGGSHCIAPRYLHSQVEQSLRNMQVDSLDLFYVHNPEAQLAEVDRYTFEARIAQAFEALESDRAEGRIRFYGVASWNGFRVAPDDKAYHSLERFADIARQVAGEKNGFKFIQLPHNLAMPEAYLLPNQASAGKAVTVLNAASDLGISVIASASLLQGQLSANVPIHLRKALGGSTDAMTSLQFVRSTPGITTALVGMSSTEHVEENMALARVSPADGAVFEELFAREKGS